MVETDLANFKGAHELGNIFGALTTRTIWLTLDLIGHGTFDTLPLEKIRASTWNVELNGLHGFSGELKLTKWFGLNKKRMHTLNFRHSNWRYLADCELVVPKYLHVEVYDEANYHAVLRQLVPMRFKRFRVKLTSVNDGEECVLAEWQTTEVDRHKFKLTAHIAKKEQAKLLGQFVQLSQKNDFNEIAVSVQRPESNEANRFEYTHEQLRMPSEPFNRYSIGEGKADRKKIQVDGEDLVMKMIGNSVEFVMPPAGARFRSIDMEFGESVSMHMDKIMALATWLAGCTNAKALKVIDHQVEILQKAIKLIVLDKVRKTREGL